MMVENKIFKTDKEDGDVVTINYNVFEQLINKYNEWKK